MFVRGSVEAEEGRLGPGSGPGSVAVVPSGDGGAAMWERGFAVAGEGVG